MNTRTGREAIKPFLSVILMGLLFALTGHTAAAEIPMGALDFGDAAVKRGRAVFASSCQTCHGLKYLGISAKMDSENAKKAFGNVPPDLSLMAKARGKGSDGARYIYALLVSFNDTPQKNSVLPYITMPPPFSQDDPQFMQDVRDVSAFLYYAADPSADARRQLGKYVLGYMIILTTLLYVLYLKTWRRVKRLT